MKVLVYCTKAKPFIHEDRNPNSKTFGSFLLSDHPDPFEKGEDDQDLNGLVVAECDVNEAFKYTTKQTEGRLYISGSHLSNFELCERSCLTNEQLNGYGRGKDLYAYHFENVRPFDEPFPINKLYSDELCAKPLTRAPQSYCFAYRKRRFQNKEVGGICFDEKSERWIDREGHQCFLDNYSWYYVEKFLVFSIRSHFVCKILNGDKDLEIRNRRVRSIWIMYR